MTVMWTGVGFPCMIFIWLYFLPVCEGRHLTNAISDAATKRDGTVATVQQSPSDVLGLNADRKSDDSHVNNAVNVHPGIQQDEIHGIKSDISDTGEHGLFKGNNVPTGVSPVSHPGFDQMPSHEALVKHPESFTAGNNVESGRILVEPHLSGTENGEEPNKENAINVIGTHNENSETVMNEMGPHKETKDIAHPVLEPHTATAPHVVQPQTVGASSFVPTVPALQEAVTNSLVKTEVEEKGHGTGDKTTSDSVGNGTKPFHVVEKNGYMYYYYYDGELDESAALDAVPDVDGDSAQAGVPDQTPKTNGNHDPVNNPHNQQPVTNGNNAQVTNPHNQPHVTNVNNVPVTSPHNQPPVTNGNHIPVNNPHNQPSLTNGNQISVNNPHNQPPVTNGNQIPVSNPHNQPPVTNGNHILVNNPHNQPPVTNGNQIPVSNPHNQPPVTNVNQIPVNNPHNQPHLTNGNQIPVSNTHNQPPVTNGNQNPVSNPHNQPSVTNGNQIQVNNPHNKPPVTNDNHVPVNNSNGLTLLTNGNNPTVNNNPQNQQPRINNNTSINTPKNPTPTEVTWVKPTAVLATEDNLPPPMSTERVLIADLFKRDTNVLDRNNAQTAGAASGGSGDQMAPGNWGPEVNIESTIEDEVNKLRQREDAGRTPEDVEPLNIFQNNIAYQRFPKPMSLTVFKNKVIGRSFRKLYILEQSKNKLFQHVRQLEANYTLEDDTLYVNLLFRFIFSRECSEISRFKLGTLIGNKDQALFQKEGKDGQTERVVFFSERPDDYVYFMSCTDNNISPYACRNSYYISLDSLHDPPNQFPWGIAATELKAKMDLTFEDKEIYI